MSNNEKRYIAIYADHNEDLLTLDAAVQKAKRRVEDDACGVWFVVEIVQAYRNTPRVERIDLDTVDLSTLGG